MRLLLFVPIALVLLVLASEVRERIKPRAHHSSGFFSPSNWLGPSPSGSWTEVALGRASEIVTYTSMGFLICLMWVAANVPELSPAALFYCVGLSITVMAQVLESHHPEWRWAALLGVGALKRWPREIGLGLVFGAIFLILLKLGAVSIIPLAPASLIFFGALAPFAEEATFGAVLTPTLAEDFGVFPALVTVSLLFGLFHWGAYAARVGPILGAMAFRFAASGLILKERCFLGAFVGHVAVNLGLLFGWP